MRAVATVRNGPYFVEKPLRKRVEAVEVTRTSE
jgi:hypothetical protein